VKRLTTDDIAAEVQNVVWTDLSVRYKLWWLIINENVRSIRSNNLRLALLLIDSPSAKSTLRCLLNERRVQENNTNALRVDYGLHVNAADVDRDIVLPARWAQQVLDWFAGRLPNAEHNRRTLYLWGAAGVGKSRLVDRLLAGRLCLRRDCCEGFFLQDLAEEYEFVWLDEFVPDFMVSRGEYRQQFNKLTGRERVLVRAKNDVQYEVDASHIRTVICSNEHPPKADYFARRLFAVKADTAIYGVGDTWK
jgi:hypothetical protein